MKSNLLEKIVSFIKAEKRICLVAVFLALVFLVNRALYSGQKITAENCSAGKCYSALIDKPQLAKGNGYYYVDDLFKDQPSGYYRLTFQEKSDQAEKLILNLDTYAEKLNQIGNLVLSPSDKFQEQEAVFFLPEGFTGLLIQKDDVNSAANIFIQDIGVTKLDITSQTEAAALKKTIIGEADPYVVASQQSNSDGTFSALKENNFILGQVFQATDTVISSVTFKIDINKNLNPSSRQYVLSLREVNYDGSDVSLNGPVIADLSFSINSIEKYRQADGTFLFPLYGMLEKGKYYLISLDNSKVEVSAQNYLEFRGDHDDASYPNGSAAVKQNKQLYLIDGDLYFRVYSAQLSQGNGAKILGGAKIEDLGKGIGKYSYTTKGYFADLFDLDSASPGTAFSDGNKVIYAPASNNASFGYTVNTLYPISKMNFSASQLNATWKNVKVSYSFDQNIWTDLASSEKSELVIDSAPGQVTDQSQSAGSSDNVDSSDDANNTNNAISPTGDSSDVTGGSTGGAAAQETLQAFDAAIVPAKEVRTVYFKITYDPNDTSKGRSFALKNLRITADLKMK